MLLPPPMLCPCERRAQPPRPVRAADPSVPGKPWMDIRDGYLMPPSPHVTPTLQTFPPSSGRYNCPLPPSALERGTGDWKPSPGASGCLAPPQSPTVTTGLSLARVKRATPPRRQRRRDSPPPTRTSYCAPGRARGQSGEALAPRALKRAAGGGRCRQVLVGARERWGAGVQGWKAGELRATLSWR